MEEAEVEAILLEKELTLPPIQTQEKEEEEAEEGEILETLEEGKSPGPRCSRSSTSKSGPQSTKQ